MFPLFAAAGVSRFLGEEDGPTATEYAVLLGLIIMVAFVGATALGLSANGVFTSMAGVFGG